MADVAYGCQFATSAKSKKGREGFIQGLRQESSRIQILEAAHEKEILEWGKTRGGEKRKFQMSDDWSNGEGSWRGCGFGRIDAGRGLEPKRGVNVAVFKFEEGSAFFCNRQLQRRNCLALERPSP